MLLTLASWLLGNKIGRFFLYTVFAVVLIAIILISVFLKGKASAKMAQKMRELDAIRERIETDERLKDMSAQQRRDELAKWVRN